MTWSVVLSTQDEGGISDRVSHWSSFRKMKRHEVKRVDTFSPSLLSLQKDVKTIIHIVSPKVDVLVTSFSHVIPPLKSI